MSKGSATKLLLNQFKGILNDPVEGFTVELEDENDLFRWRVYIEGPKDTPYEGGVFQLRLTFPPDYPMLPPTLKFISEFWHPNVHHDGKVCISILHNPGEDVMSGERPEERWMPTQTVGTIMLSVISILNDPNLSSPANVDASVEWRKNKAGYKERCQRLAKKANAEKPEHVVIPHPDTDATEKARHVEKMKILNGDMDMDDFAYDDNEQQEEDDDEEMEDTEEEEEDEDEGMGEDEHKSPEQRRPSVTKTPKAKTPNLRKTPQGRKASLAKTPQMREKGKGKEKDTTGASGDTQPSESVPAVLSPPAELSEVAVSTPASGEGEPVSDTRDASTSDAGAGKKKKRSKDKSGAKVKKEKCIVM